MSEFDVIRLLIAVGVLLMMAASAGFALLWQRQQHLSLALQAAQGPRTTLGLTNNPARQPEAVHIDQPKVESPAASITFSSALAQTSAGRGVASVVAPPGAVPSYSKGSEEDRLRALLAGRTAVRSGGASPQQRPWSP